MSDHAPLIVLVGHCGPDSFMLRNVAQRAVPGARVESADDRESLQAAAADADLLLVNRVLDTDVGYASGIDLIRDLSPNARAAMMLISNYPDAQTQAEAAGAVPGFGKRDAYAEETAERIRRAVARSARDGGAAS